MRKFFLWVIGLIILFQVRVYADEGMWLLSLIGQVNMDEMSEMGLQLTAEQIYSINKASLKDAVGAAQRTALCYVDNHVATAHISWSSRAGFYKTAPVFLLPIGSRLVL